MNEYDFDDGLKQIMVCAYGADCGNATVKKYGSPTAIYDAIKKARNEAGLNRKVYVVRTSCQGWCEYAPVCTALPEGKVYRDIKPEEAEAFVTAMAEGKDEAFSKRQIWNFSQTRAQNQKNKAGL